MSTAIEKYKAGELLPALTNDPKAIIEALVANIGNSPLTESAFTKIKVPGSGGTFFEIPTIEGPIPEKELIGVIVFHTPSRAYFDRPYDEAGDEDKFPVCSSDDGLVGIGEPGGNCQACPLSKFNTAVKAGGKVGKGQACSEKKRLFMMRGDQMFPDLIQVPATSLQACTNFLLSLAKSAIRYDRALIGISLKKVENGDGVNYAEMEFRFIRKLQEAELPAAEAWNTLTKTIMAESSARAREIATQRAAGQGGKL